VDASSHCVVDTRSPRLGQARPNTAPGGAATGPGKWAELVELAAPAGVV
jgi:hypothetical protein